MLLASSPSYDSLWVGWLNLISVLYPPDALAPLLARLPAPETSTPAPLREIRRRCPPAARLSSPLLAILAAAYLLMFAGLVVLVVSATMPRPSP